MIVATGASALWLGLDSETRLRGRGVSACATCDGFFFRDKEIAVVGGGDTALEEALFLTRFATKVHLLHRRDAFRGSKIMEARAERNPKIEIHLNGRSRRCSATPRSTGLRLRDTKTGERRRCRSTACSSRSATGPTPGLFDDWLEMDEDGLPRGRRRDDGFERSTASSSPATSTTIATARR